MFRSYWRIAALLAGLILVAASPSGQPGKPEQEQRTTSAEHALRDIALALQNANGPDRTTRPCAKHQEDRSSDLCAQWKAADAAGASAAWAERTFWLGIGGLIIGFFTLVAAGAAAKFAYDAAKAARDTLHHAQHEARPWISIKAKAEKVSVTGNALRLYYRISVENVGKLVATNVMVVHETTNGAMIEEDTAQGFAAQWEKNRRPTEAVIMPGETTSYSLWSFMAKELFSWEDSPDSFFYPALIVYAMYNVLGDETPRWSRRVFRFGMKGEKGMDALLQAPVDPVVLCIREDCLPLEEDELVLESFGSAAA